MNIRAMYEVGHYQVVQGQVAEQTPAESVEPHNQLYYNWIFLGSIVLDVTRYDFRY
jgi:hypothetical protein